jgi:hypothetical protein
MEAGDRLDHRLGLSRAHAADATHLFAETLLPEFAIGVQHDFHRAAIFERGQEIGTEIAHQLVFCPRFDGRRRRDALIHDQMHEQSIANVKTKTPPRTSVRADHPTCDQARSSTDVRETAYNRIARLNTAHGSKPTANERQVINCLSPACGR